MHTTTTSPEVRWRVWVLPFGDTWALACGPTIKGNRRARKVTLDDARYHRLLEGRLDSSELLDEDSAHDELETAA